MSISRITQLFENVYNTKGSVDVAIQDQTTPQVNLYLNKPLGDFALSDIQTKDSYTINVLAGHGATAGEYVCIQEEDPVNGLLRFYQAKIITANATDFEMSRPLDYAFDPLKVLCAKRTRVNMVGEVGTTAAPIIYKIAPLYGRWHIYQLHFKMFSPTGTFDDGTFGPLAALTHGLTIRKSNGYDYNQFNFTTNGEILGYSEGGAGYSPKPPAGTGAGFTATISLIQGNGTVPLLDADSDGSLEVWLPDSLAAWPVGGSLEIKAEGHIVE